MHISEGILSGGVLIAGWAGTLAGVSVGLKKTNPDKIVKVALLSSAFFLASLVNVKIGPSSTHLSLLAPMGLILGWAAFPAILVALLLQAVLFHFGGLLVLGVNAFIMGFSAVSVYLLFREKIRGTGSKIYSFIAGALAVMIAALLVGLSLGLTDGNFLTAAKLIILVHLPLSLIEGLATMFIISWLKRVSPEFLS